MKRTTTMKSMLLVAALFLMGMYTSAEGKLAVVPYMKTNYTLITAIPSESGFYSVSIVDKMGDMMYTSSRFESGENFLKVFDFSYLADGDYKVRLRSRNGVNSEEVFKVESGRLASEAPAMAEATTGDVYMWSASDFLFVSHLNKELNELSIRLEDAYGNEIYRSSLPSDLTYSGKFNISELPRGSYAVSFVSGDKVYNYGFRK